MGRPPYPRDEHGNIIRPGDPGFDDLGRDADSGILGDDEPARGLSDLGQRVARGAGGRFVKRSDSGPEAGSESGGRSEATDKPKKPRVSRKVEASAEPITVEPTQPKINAPKNTTRVSAKGSFRAEHVTRTTEALFGMLAMTMNKKHWAVQDRRIEVDPWAPAAAELLNKYIPDIETAERATDLMAGMAVVMGIGGMISARVSYDRELAAAARAQAARAKRELLIEQEHRIDPDQPATGQTGASQGMSSNGTGPRHRPGSGAAPTSPGKIDGLGGSGGAF
jgi:hypothetical protein